MPNLLRQHELFIIIIIVGMSSGAVVMLMKCLSLAGGSLKLLAFPKRTRFILTNSAFIVLLMRQHKQHAEKKLICPK